MTRREAWLPALPEGVPQARAIVRDLASELRLDDATTWELMLATTEAFMYLKLRKQTYSWGTT